MSVIIRHKTIGDFDLYMSYTANTRDLSYSDRHFSVWMTYKSYGDKDYYRTDEYYENLSDAIKAYKILYDFILEQYNG